MPTKVRMEPECVYGASCIMEVETVSNGLIFVVNSNKFVTESGQVHPS